MGTPESAKAPASPCPNISFPTSPGLQGAGCTDVPACTAHTGSADAWGGESRPPLSSGVAGGVGSTRSAASPGPGLPLAPGPQETHQRLGPQDVQAFCRNQLKQDTIIKPHLKYFFFLLISLKTEQEMV